MHLLSLAHTLGPLLLAHSRAIKLMIAPGAAHMQCLTDSNNCNNNINKRGKVWSNAQQLPAIAKSVATSGSTWHSGKHNCHMPANLSSDAGLIATTQINRDRASDRQRESGKGWWIVRLQAAECDRHAHHSYAMFVQSMLKKLMTNFR